MDKVLQHDKNIFRFSSVASNVEALVSYRNHNAGYKQDVRLIEQNRRTILADASIALSQLACCKQTHDNGVAIVTQNDAGRGAVHFEDAFDGVDALITKETNIALAIFTADCLPVYIVDETKKVIALVHAGWRSTKKDISGKTVGILEKIFSCRPSQLKIYFGPALRQCCYEVDEDFAPYFSRGVYRKNEQLFLDLPYINMLQLQKAGVNAANIVDCGICTICRNDLFFSYR